MKYNINEEERKTLDLIWGKDVAKLPGRHGLLTV